MRFLVFCIAILAYTHAGTIPAAAIPFVTHQYLLPLAEADKVATIKTTNLPLESVDRSKRQIVITAEPQRNDASAALYPGAYKRSVQDEKVGNTEASVKTTTAHSVPANVLGYILG